MERSVGQGLERGIETTARSRIDLAEWRGRDVTRQYELGESMVPPERLRRSRERTEIFSAEHEGEKGQEGLLEARTFPTARDMMALGYAYAYGKGVADRVTKTLRVRGMGTR
ncbi:hypothetical protein KKP04_09055 [Rhodomicrobium sp. Az07]|uniref:hypothetical protein n=1 Tax=Rhodomicrobium sp. Az07 TaxID=2839034 RepID=UPI001BEB20D0|nr:hypothetical protein [Rhodomicrobium sp. Az07]MBT3071016.1 hypothetical protein [Rhodomicrobium sp. Az07]